MPGKIKKTGGVQSRVGERFYKAVNLIIDERLKNGKSKDRVAIEKITNLIVRYKLWPEVAKEIIELDEEEVNKYGNG